MELYGVKAEAMAILLIGLGWVLLLTLVVFLTRGEVKNTPGGGLKKGGGRK